MSKETHLIELESKIAHQDHTIQTLSEEIYRQQKKLDQLEATCNFLAEQLSSNNRAIAEHLKTRTDGSTPANPDDEKPPHF